jgi:hypothetical protein
MIRAYTQDAEPTLFLSSKFQTPEDNFYNTQEVEIDIVRSEEDVSIAITDMSTGYRMNSADVYTNKSFIAPVHKEAFPINAFDLIKRMPGQDPFENPNFQANAMVKAFNGFRKIEKKIRRSIELQASQVFQLGIVTLVDAAGTTVYTIDYKPKATHLVTASPVWNGVSPTIVADLAGLANVIRNDGLVDPDELYMGGDAFETAMADTDFKARFDTRRIDLGGVKPMMPVGAGGQYRGFVDIDNYKFDIYTYGGRYVHPQTGTKTQFLDPANVVMRASSGRLDATFGAIPRIVPPEARVLPFMPGRISSVGGNIDLFTNVWVSDDGEQLFGGVGARPLLIPTAIDTFGVIYTGV